MNPLDNFLIVGLGNPGPKYELTRHNIGFLLLDAFAMKNKVPLIDEKKFIYGKLKNEQQNIYLLKPQEYMNLSGKAVSEFVNKYKISLDKVLVLHDELDFPFSKIKLKSGGGHAGHNGLKDIISKINSKDFHRLRFGIGRPTSPNIDISDYVLSKFSQEEKKLLPELIKTSIGFIEEWLNKQILLKQ